MYGGLGCRKKMAGERVGPVGIGVGPMVGPVGIDVGLLEGPVGIGVGAELGANVTEIADGLITAGVAVAREVAPFAFEFLCSVCWNCEDWVEDTRASVRALDAAAGEEKEDETALGMVTVCIGD